MFPLRRELAMTFTASSSISVRAYAPRGMQVGPARLAHRSMPKSGRPDFGCQEGIWARFVAGNILIMWAFASGFHGQSAHAPVGEPASAPHRVRSRLLPAHAAVRAF